MPTHVIVAENSQRTAENSREQPEEENKMEGKILRLYCIDRSRWKNKFLSKLHYK